jgi:hypothetical protein
MPVEADRVLAQHDGPPGDLPTSQWTPDLLVFDRHTLVLPNDLPSGRYRVTVGVYWFGDRQPLPVDGAPYTVVGTLDVP